MQQCNACLQKPSFGDEIGDIPRTEMRTAHDMILMPSLPAGRSSSMGSMIGCGSSTALALGSGALLMLRKSSALHATALGSCNPLAGTYDPVPSQTACCCF